MPNQNRISRLSELLDDNQKKELGERIIRNIEAYGFASMSKADYEAFIFDVLMKISNAEGGAYRIDNYKWMALLKVTPSKLRSLQMLSSAKFNNLDYNEDNWRIVLKNMVGKSIELEDPHKGTVRFFIDNTHAQRFIEKFTIDKGSSTDYTLNRGQMVMKYELFNQLIEELLNQTEVDANKIITQLKKDKSVKELNKEMNSISGAFKEIGESFKDEALSEAAKISFNLLVDIATKAAKKKLGLD